jgi:hypothetical protein
MKVAKMVGLTEYHWVVLKVAKMVGLKVANLVVL